MMRDNPPMNRQPTDESVGYCRGVPHGTPFFAYELLSIRAKISAEEILAPRVTVAMPTPSSSAIRREMVGAAGWALGLDLPVMSRTFRLEWTMPRNIARTVQFTRNPSHLVYA